MYQTVSQSGPNGKMTPDNEQASKRERRRRITSQCLQLWWPHGIIWQLWTGWTLQTVPTYISLNKWASHWNSSWILTEFLILWRWPLQADSNPVLIQLKQIEVRSFMERTGSAGLFHWCTAAASRKGDSQSCASPLPLTHWDVAAPILSLLIASDG